MPIAFMIPESFDSTSLSHKPGRSATKITGPLQPGPGHILIADEDPGATARKKLGAIGAGQ
jgi:hypothetical protein